MKKQRETYVEGWKLYPVSMIGHHIQGVLVAMGILLGSQAVLIASVSWMVLYVSYQGLSVPRKKDSPGLDIADFMAGFGFGLVAASIWTYLI